MTHYRPLVSDSYYMHNKYGLLVCEGVGITKNIGDYIQSIAQEQYLPSEYTFVEREHLDEFESDISTKVIMNGWFMHNPTKFPPSASIEPLFVSFHIVPKIAENFFTKDCIEYLKNYEPIGARDYSTMELLAKHGIKNYFSGCLTLCLGKEYLSQDKTEDVYFVDPYYDFSMGKGLIGKITNVLDIIRFLPKTLKLKSVFIYEREYKLPKNPIISKIKKLVWITNFYKSYRSAFSDEILFSAKYVTHSIPQTDIPGNKAKLEYARKLLRNYSRAKLVVTSRIHCALPCIGIETPVIFVTSDVLEGNGLRSTGRFGGLINLMNVMSYTPNRISPITQAVKEAMRDGKITLKSKIKNSDDYKLLRDDLEARVVSFVNK